MGTKEIQVRIENFVEKFADEMFKEKPKTGDEIVKFFIKKIAVVSIKLDIVKERETVFVEACEEAVRLCDNRESLEQYEIDSIVCAAKTALAKLKEKV